MGNPASHAPLCLIGGPTATGKTAVAVELARRWNSEVISADSMQVYRRLSIGTAKPTPAETRGVPYHLIDCLDPGEERFSAAEFLSRARPLIDRLLSAGRAPIVAGGTGLYLDVLRKGLFSQPEIPPEVRRELEAELAREGSPALHERLARIDADAAARIHPNDGVRIVRALEVHRATGRTITQLRAEGRGAAPPYATMLFVLNAPRKVLYARIERRVELMFEQGLVEETKALLARGYSPTLHCMKALGYGAIAVLLAGDADLAATIAAVKQAHRNYAKRQLTWFRKMKGARWISVENASASAVADMVEKCLEPVWAAPA